MVSFIFRNSSTAQRGFLKFRPSRRNEQTCAVIVRVGYINSLFGRNRTVRYFCWVGLEDELKVHSKYNPVLTMPRSSKK